MEKKKLEVAVWLLDGWARLIVDAPSAKNPSRWVTQGTIVDEAAMGFWLKGDNTQAFTIQELRPVTGGAKQVNWMFKSSQLFIRWDAIITIQAFEGGAKDFGFKAVAATAE
jgi:hypothetical protein